MQVITYNNNSLKKVVNFLISAKWPGCEADDPPPSAEVKNVWRYTSTPTVCFHGMVLG